LLSCFTTICGFVNMLTSICGMLQITLIINWHLIPFWHNSLNFNAIPSNFVHGSYFSVTKHWCNMSCNNVVDLEIFLPYFWLLLFVFSIFILLSRESDGGAIFWTNPNPLMSCPFLSFPVVWLLATEFAACSKPPSRDNHRKTLYPRTQQRDRRGW